MEETKMVTLRLPQDIYVILKEVANQQNRSISNLLCTLGIEKAKEYLEQQKPSLAE